jgi:hypothetical protein
MVEYLFAVYSMRREKGEMVFMPLLEKTRLAMTA